MRGGRGRGGVPLRVVIENTVEYQEEVRRRVIFANPVCYLFSVHLRGVDGFLEARGEKHVGVLSAAHLLPERLRQIFRQDLHLPKHDDEKMEGGGES